MLDEDRLRLILDSMIIPESRRKDYRWLSHNIGFYNALHYEIFEAVDILKCLIKKEK